MKLYILILNLMNCSFTFLRRYLFLFSLQLLVTAILYVHSGDRFHTSDGWPVQSQVYYDKDDLKAIFQERSLFRSPFAPRSKGESSVGVSWNATPFEFLLTQIRDRIPLTTSYCEYRPGMNKKGLFIISTVKSNLFFGCPSFIINQGPCCLA